MSFFKKTLLVMSMAILMTSIATASNPIEKLGRGVASIAFSPMELLIQPVEVARDKGNIAGLTYGVINGVCFTIARIGVGLADVVTFLSPLPGCTDSPYDIGWGYGPMAFKDTPWVVGVENNWAGFFYDEGTLIESDF